MLGGKKPEIQGRIPASHVVHPLHSKLGPSGNRHEAASPSGGRRASNNESPVEARPAPGQLAHPRAPGRISGAPSRWARHSKFVERTTGGSSEAVGSCNAEPLLQYSSYPSGPGQVRGPSHKGLPGFRRCVIANCGLTECRRASFEAAGSSLWPEPA